jgi:hypothetical protein
MIDAGHGEQTVILPTGQTNSSQAIATALNDCGNYLLDRINNSATFYPPGFAAELANIIGHPVKLPNILAPRDWVASLVNQFKSYLAYHPSIFLEAEESRVIQRVSTDSGGFDDRAVGVDRGNRGRFQAAATRFSQVAA